MRQSRSWEVFENHKTNREWSAKVHILERDIPLEVALEPYLSKEEMQHVLSKGNKSTALLFLQSKNLRILKEKGFIWEFSFLELENNLQEFFTLQGKSERIKNFPYPRQYATLGYLFVRIFLILLPFGLIPAFNEIGTLIKELYPCIGSYFIWLAVPFCTVVAWVFHTMERIGHVGENPFEGSANDVPISTISRGIEIDIRQMLGDDNETIPKPLIEQFNVQM
jgi:putative membrane protein